MIDAPWLLLARKDIGNAETLGPNDSPWLRKMWAGLSGSWLLGQPWCGGAVAHWMRGAGVAYPKAYYRAKAWLDWGIPLSAPAVGCVVVFDREGGGHVGLVVGRSTGGNLLVLGGNQGNAVTVKPFALSRVLGYRWPMHTRIEPDEGMTRLPVYVAETALSEREA